jgi:hypothetical protein
MTPLHRSRRALLRGLGATAAVGLAGCCCRPFPSSLITDAPQTASAMRPILKPLRISSVSKRPQYWLDAHAHFFNSSDANVKGYFEGGVVRSLKPKELQPLARLMAPLMDKLTESAPTAKQEFDLLSQRARLAGPTAAAPGVHPLQDVADAHRQKIAPRRARPTA